MMEPVVRDVDVVTQVGTFGSAETVSETASGQQLFVIDSSTTGANLSASVAAAGANSTVIVQGDFTGVNSRVNLQSGQTLMGKGSITVKSPSGRTATLQTGAASITGTGGVFSSVSSLINMANNSSLSGVNVNNLGSGGNGTATILVDGVSGVTIRANTIRGSASGNTATPIFVEGGSSDITITDNTLSATTAGSLLAVGGAMVNVGNNINFSNNAITATGSTDTRALFLRDATNLTGSGNTRGGLPCNTSGTNSGAISFTDGGTCP